MAVIETLIETYRSKTFNRTHRYEPTLTVDAPVTRGDPDVKRFPDWELRLQRTLKEWSERGFAWGESDCVHFVCACLEALTGENHLSDIAVYNTEREALQILACADHRGLQQAVEIVLGPSVEHTHAFSPFAKGDVVMTMRRVVGTRDRMGPGLGICMGDTALFVGEEGLEHIDTSDCICGWLID